MLAIALLSGCGHNTFLTKEVYDQAHTAGLPPRFEENSCPVTAPITALTPAPPTVNNPDRKPRPLTLQEAIAIALENGTVSSRSGSGRGLVDDTLASFTGPATLNGQSDRIRVIALNPALFAAALEGTFARFDSVLHSSLNYTGTDNLLQGLSSFNNGHGAQFQSSIIKPLSSGGVANISFLTNYTNLSSPPTGTVGVINPNYTARLSIGIEQPLWRDFGVEINQLTSRVTGLTGLSVNGSGALASFNNHLSNVSAGLGSAGGGEGILIARLRFDQSRAEFERNVQVLLLNTEVAYWNLYNKYGQLYSFEENLRVLQRAIYISEKKQKAGGEDPINYHQTRGQFQEFRGERVRALQEVLEAERNLRGILGLANEDGDRLIPITPPTLSEHKPRWDHCLQDTLNTRPELALARDNLRYHQYLLTVQKNLLKPDLRAYARWEPVGVGSTLAGTNEEFTDGTGTLRTTNAFQSLAGAHFADYQFGVNLSVPLGYRFESAAVRAERLQLSQSYWFLRDQEDKATRFLQQQYQELDRWYRLIEATRSERLGYQNALKTLIEQAKVGKGILGGPQSLEIQRRYASAYVKEYNAITEYNNTLARLEWAKGTTLRHNNVHISEGPLPQAAQVRATDEEKRRSEAFVLRHRPDALTQPGRVCANGESELFDDKAPPLEAPVQVPGEKSVGKETAPKSFPAVLTDGQRTIMPNPFTGEAVPKTEPTRNARPLDAELAPFPKQERGSFQPSLSPAPRGEPMLPMPFPVEPGRLELPALPVAR